MIVLRIPKPTHFKARQFEWGMAVLLLVWAANVALSPTAFDQPTLAAMRNTAGLWISACCLIATVRLLALYINGTWHASPFIRAATASLSGLFWLAFAGGIWTAHLANTGTPVYVGLAAFDLYGAYQASKDARVAWDRARESVHAPAGKP